MIHLRYALIIVVWSLQPSLSWAADWLHCPPWPSFKLPSEYQSTGANTDISAREATRINDALYHFKGEVRLIDNQQYLQSDEATYNTSNGDLSAIGNIQYQKNSMTLFGETAEINLNNSKGKIRKVDFRLNDRHTRGKARTAELQGNGQTRLSKVKYTSCNPGTNDWLLKSSSVELNQTTGIGTAYNVSLSFMHLPFLYLPYISFPINDERKSGFLTPTFNHTSISGNDFSIPYYINIAPDTDATLTPRYLTRRGNMIGAELRYLRPYNNGEMHIEYLPNDQLYDDYRGLFKYEHHGWTHSDIHSDIELNMVSDRQYFEQLGNSLNSSSITHLLQQAGFSYSGHNWYANAIVQGYQTVDETIPDSSRPYRRLPQLSLSHRTPQHTGQINLLFESNYTRFNRSGRPSGKRLDFRPGLSFPMRTDGTYFTPKVSWYETYYQMNDPITNFGNDFKRSLPVFSIDSGLIFERMTKNSATSWLHTLEPRLYYLNIPYREQAHIPLFDSGLPDFTYYRLFSDNRFNGIDRIGDTEQVTLGVTTRFINPTSGRELFSGSIGQIFYAKDRQVSLTGGTTDSANASAILAVAQASIKDKLSLGTDFRWDTYQNKFDRVNFQVRYHPEKRRIMNLSYRFHDTLLEQSDMSVLWPMSRQLYFLGRWNYSFLQKQTLEGVAGIEYQSCCWALRLASRRYLSDTAGEFQNSIYLQIELKGLMNIGDSIEKLLENGILGYQK